MPRVRGEQHHGSKLTEQAVLDIRAESEARLVPPRVFAERYGVSEGAVRDARQGRTWKHLLPEGRTLKQRTPTSLEQGTDAPPRSRPSGRHHGEQGGSVPMESARKSGTSSRGRERVSKVCRIADCEAQTHARGLCNTHYRQHRRKYGHLACAVEGCTNHPDHGAKGDRLHLQRSTGRRGNQTGRKVWLCRRHERLHLAPSEEIEQLNLDRLAMGIRSNEHGCWIWTGRLSPGPTGGYGLFDPEGSNGIDWYAHRALFDLLAGGHEHGLQLDHRCNERACVAPHHLRPVTASANGKRRGKAVEEPTEWKALELPAVQQFAWKHGLPGMLWN